MSDETFVNDGSIYPWQDVDRARKDKRLRRKHPVNEGKQTYQSKACPRCGAKAEGLEWFYFESPQETWAKLCGTAGWMTVCDRCHVQVDYFEEILN